MNAKTFVKTVFLAALFGLLLLMSWHNRAPVDFNLLPVAKQTFYGPVALMGFVFFGFGMLMGLIVCIRTERKSKSSPDADETTQVPRITVPRIASEPPVGSRIS